MDKIFCSFLDYFFHKKYIWLNAICLFVIIMNFMWFLKLADTNYFLKKQEMELNNYVQQLITSCITTPNNLQFADCDWLLKNQIVPNHYKNNKN